jgi:aminopeptidase N
MGFFSVGLNAHELMHQWFGDYVTCENWEHIWLNEGFGSYGEYFNLEHTNPAGARAWMDDAHNQAISEPLGSIVTPPNPVTARIFNRALTYKKSAAVIHMLRYQMGDAAFYKGVRDYLEQFAFSTANSTQFKTALENSSGQNLEAFFNEWVFGYGYPGYQIRWNQVEDSILIDIRSSGSSSQTPTFSIPIPLRAAAISGESTFFNLSPGVYKLPVTGITDVLWLDEASIILKGISNVDRDPGFVSTKPTDLKALTTVWPNPSHNGKLFIRFDKPGAYQLRILSPATGKELYRQQISQPQFEEKPPLNQGIYLLEITDLNTAKVAHWKWLVTGK